MLTGELPIHPYTGLQALGVLPSGRIVWPVMGGDGSGDGSGDGGQGDGGQGGDGDSQGGDTRTFTQADVDRIVADRLRRVQQKYADYDQLKEKAAKYDEIDQASKTELERERERAHRAEAECDELRQRLQQVMISAEIAKHAGTAGAIDVGDVVKLLADSPDITVGKDGQVAGAEEAVKRLAKAKPHLFRTGQAGGFAQGARRDGGAEEPSVARGRELYLQRRQKRT